MFKIIGEINAFTPTCETLHVGTRQPRVALANQLIIAEKAKPIKICMVDKGHVNGDEIHVIYNNGVINIYNANTRRHITTLIAREKQITRYGIKPTKTMLKKIREHVARGYNYA